MIEFRGATEDDLESLYEVFVQAEGEVWQRQGLDWSPLPVEVFAAVHRHLLEHDGNRAFVALDGGAIVAYTAAMAREDTWYFASLFVLPNYQGQRLGQQLLERAWTGSFTCRITITDSHQPASNGLYARRGLIPTTPILKLTGTGACEKPEDLDASAADGEAMVAIDRAAYGFDRRPDHQFWQEQKGQPRLWRRSGQPVGYTYTDPLGLIGPLAALTAVDAAEVLRAELARRNDQQTTVVVPGTARELVSAGLAAGLRFTGLPDLLLLSDGCPVPTAIALSASAPFLY